MAALLTLCAFTGGVAGGIIRGGTVRRIIGFRPRFPATAIVGLTLAAVSAAIGSHHNAAIGTRVGALAALLVFASANIRVGGMILAVVGLALSLSLTVLNWAGLPDRASGPETGNESQIQSITSVGAAPDHGDELAIRLLNIDIGTAMTAAGVALAGASLTRGRRLPRPGPQSYNYARRIAPLGRGPVDSSGPHSHVRRLQ